MIMIIHLAALAGQVIATVRSLTGLPQGEFGEAVGVAGSQISGYERSKSIPSIDILVRLLARAGWRLAALPARQAETWEQREAVVEAARRLSAVERGDDASPSGDAALMHVCAAVNGLNDAERAAHLKARNTPNRVDELLRLRKENAELRHNLLDAQTCAEQILKAAREITELHP